jgi:hypothetical protein
VSRRPRHRVTSLPRRVQTRGVTFRRPARALLAHGLLVGCSPLLILLAATPPARATYAATPAVLQGGVLVMVAGIAFPLLWPLAIALGLREGSMAERLTGGHGDVLRRARRTIAFEATVLTVLATAVLLVAVCWWAGAGDGRADPRLLGAWIVPALFAGAHWWLRAGLGRRPEADRRTVETLTRGEPA